jgi:ADP-ribose pyrophosphatase YjhB (NUDIX family)
MKYCNVCGQAVETLIPAGDNRERHVCSDCGTVHYVNPKMVVGAVVEWGEQILLCKRAIEPRRGLWTVPAGFLELGETLEQGAAREALEEAQAQIQIQALLSVINVTRVGQVHVMFRARLANPSFGVGEESLEVDLFKQGDIPWDELAFPSVRFTLERYYQDRAAGRAGVHVTEVGRWS